MTRRPRGVGEPEDRAPLNRSTRCPALFRCRGAPRNGRNVAAPRCTADSCTPLTRPLNASTERSGRAAGWSQGRGTSAPPNFLHTSLSPRGCDGPIDRRTAAPPHKTSAAPIHASFAAARQSQPLGTARERRHTPSPPRRPGRLSTIRVRCIASVSVGSEARRSTDGAGRPRTRQKKATRRWLGRVRPCA